MKAINDRRIDLTIDMKFNSSDRKWVLFEEGRSNEWKERVAWLKSRPITFESTFPRVKRLYGDTLSDDFGCIVRRNSIGKWVFFQSETQFRYPELVIEEWMYEEMGGEKGLPLKPCYCCGKTFFSRGNLECVDCKLGSHSEVPNKFFKTNNLYKLTENIRSGFGLTRRHV